MLEKVLVSNVYLHPHDNVNRVKKLVNRYKVYEFPVVGDEGFVGVARITRLVRLMKRFRKEDFLVSDLLERKYVSWNVEEPLNRNLRRLLTSKRDVAMVFHGDEFLGFVDSRNLLKLLDKRDVVLTKEAIEKPGKTLKVSDDAKKLVKALEDELTVLVKDGKVPVSSFSVDELAGVVLINDLLWLPPLKDMKKSKPVGKYVKKVPMAEVGEDFKTLVKKFLKAKVYSLPAKNGLVFAKTLLRLI